MKAQTWTPDTYGENVTDKAPLRPTVTALEPERIVEPRLYLPDGRPLADPPRAIGFRRS